MLTWGWFNRREFACNCGCGFDTIDAELLWLCNIVRDHVNEPVAVSCGCRCRDHNAAVGGVKHSQHLIGRAADLIVAQPQEVYDFLDKKFPGQYGFGVYTDRGFVHVDSRSGSGARWSG